MANNGGQKYRVNRRIRNNARMMATCDIRPGDEIVAEAPLVSLTTTLEKLFSSKLTFSDTQCSASTHFDQAVNQSTPETQATINGLFRTGDGWMSTFITNTFEEKEYRNGQCYTMFLLFDDISRANHSCRPNAVWSWDVERGHGALHALHSISGGDEINVDYHPEESTSLRTTEKRRKELNDSHKFRCECTACNDVEDDERRRKAARLWRSSNNEAGRKNESEAQTVLRKLRDAKSYITTLIELKLHDFKLGDAYGQLADLENQAFDSADADDHQAACPCERDPGHGVHLERANKALSDQSAVQICCSGPEHPDLKVTWERMRSMQMKLLQYQRH